MGTCEDTFLIEYFKAMRAEISLRISDHKKMVTAKVISCGALLSFLLTENLDDTFRQFGFILLPLIAMLYDVMIAKNIRCIHRIATWIREELEPVLAPQKTMWEQFSGQKDIKSRNYGKADILFLSIFSIATTLFSIYVLKEHQIDHYKLFVLFLFSLQILVIGMMSRWILFFIEPQRANRPGRGKKHDA